MLFQRTKTAKFFRTALAATFFAYIAVVFGAYTRLSEAAIGCSDSLGCVGREQPPMTAHEYRASIGPIDLFPNKRAWKDMVSRYVAGALGLLMIRMVVLAWQLRKRRANQQVLMPVIAMGSVFGLTIVSLLLIDYQSKPLVLMLQLLGSLAILALLWWIVLREQRIFPSASRSALTRSLRPRTTAALAIIVSQIVLGGWSMVNYAGLACPDFPTCQEAYWPNMDFVEGFTLWRDAGPGYENEMLSLPAATAVHVAHRVGALITILYLGWLALHLLRVGHQDRLCRYGLLLLVMLLFAAALGITEAVARLPLAAGVAHNAVAALFLMSVITLYHAVRAPRALSTK